MIQKINIDEKVLEKARDCYNQLIMDPVQHEALVSVAKLMCQFVPIDEIAMRGFFVEANEEWEKVTGKHISSLTSASSTERIRIIQSLFEILRNIIVSHVKNDIRNDLNKGMDEGFSLYYKNWADRK